MEILILDTLLRPIDVVDVFESMIWTERFSEMGDFELVTLSTPSYIKRFVTDTWITVTGSRRVMIVETVEISIDPDSGSILKIKGREIVSILEARAALKSLGGLAIAPSWLISEKTPGEVIRYMFQEICVFGSVTVSDIIPYIQPGQSLYPASTIPEPSDLIEWEQKPAPLYSGMKELANIYDLGIRLYKDPNSSRLFFDVYSGSDRTTAQTTLPPVIFSPDLENLQNTSEYSTIEKAFNVVQVIYIRHDQETDTDVVTALRVHEDENAPTEKGFDRRTKILMITSVPEDVVDLGDFLIRAGRDELMKSRPVSAFDGEISQSSGYVYERDYFLGDLVETRTINGSTSYMRVVEHISVQDKEGERSYPTLVTKQFINSGTWLSWKYDVEWSAMGSEEYWSNQ